MRIPDAILPQAIPGHTRGGRPEPVQPSPRVTKDKRDDPHRRRDYDDGPALDVIVGQESAPKAPEEPTTPPGVPADDRGRSGEEESDDTEATTGRVIDESA